MQPTLLNAAWHPREECLDCCSALFRLLFRIEVLLADSLQSQSHETDLSDIVHTRAPESEPESLNHVLEPARLPIFGPACPEQPAKMAHCLLCASHEQDTKHDWRSAGIAKARC